MKIAASSKRSLCFSVLLIALASLFILSSCASSKSASFTAADEIATYTKVDSDRVQLSVSSVGNNANIRAIAKAFEAANPDIQVICFDLTGGTSDYSPVVDGLLHGVIPDVMFVNYNTFSVDTFTDDTQIASFLQDLSSFPVAQQFEAEALNRVAIDGRLYFLPAPSEVNCIIYNKTLFERYGWELPVTFDDFVALCLQIREDTDGTVQPWNPNAKYDSVFSLAIQAFVYDELFGGVDNRGWYNDFCAGNASFAGHMEPLFDVLQTLIDNDILREEHFNYSATTRGKEFQDGLIAMYNAPVSHMSSDKYTFGYMPYPTTQGNLGYVNDVFSSMLCIPVKENSDAVVDAIDRFVSFYGSPEGQLALIGGSLMVSNVKDVPLNDSDAMSGIEEAIRQGHMFSRLDFAGSGAATLSVKDCALSMLLGESSADDIIADIDANLYATSDASSAVKLADVTEDFTTLDFSFYIADMYRETASADIGLINHGIAYRGNLVRVYAGEIFDSYMYPLRPRSFANGSTLVKLSMTGTQLLAALNHPVGNECVSDSVYAFSGLTCEVAPWNELGSKYLSVTLSDGSAIQPGKLYTVACWAGTVADEYITETLQTYEGSWDDLMAAKLSSDKTISPASDSRIKLVWD